MDESKQRLFDTAGGLIYVRPDKERLIGNIKLVFGSDQ
jgi:hypothetical protein